MPWDFELVICGSVCARDSVTVKLSRIFASVTENLDDLYVIFLNDRFFGLSEHLSGNSGAYVTDSFRFLECMIYHVASHTCLCCTHIGTHFSVVKLVSKCVQLLTFVKVLLHSKHMHILRGDCITNSILKWFISCFSQVCCHQSPKRGRLKVHLGPFSGFWWVNDTYLWY